MKANFTKKDDKLIIEIDLEQDIYNPYMEEVVGKMPNIACLITKDNDGNDECGLSQLIDREYKGKDPDITPLFYEYWGDVEDWEKICKELGLGIYRI